MISKTPSTNALAEEASPRGFIQPARVRIAASDSRSSTAAGSPRRVPLSHTIAYVFPSTSPVHSESAGQVVPAREGMPRMSCSLAQLLLHTQDTAQARRRTQSHGL